MSAIEVIEVIKPGAQGIPGITDHPEQTGFFAFSTASFTISTDPDNPSFVGMENFSSDGNLEMFDANQGAIKNVSGRVLNMSGTFSYTPKTAGGGGNRILHIFAESSVDEGVTWSILQGSHRPVEISNTTESFKTTVSFLQNWPVGLIGRFRMYAEGGAIDIAPPSVTALGELITGNSIIFEHSETFRNTP